MLIGVLNFAATGTYKRLVENSGANNISGKPFGYRYLHLSSIGDRVLFCTRISVGSILLPSDSESFRNSKSKCAHYIPAKRGT